jgi:hypothetical protein
MPVEQAARFNRKIATTVIVVTAAIVATGVIVTRFPSIPKWVLAQAAWIAFVFGAFAAATCFVEGHYRKGLPFQAGEYAPPLSEFGRTPAAVVYVLTNGFFLYACLAVVRLLHFTPGLSEGVPVMERWVLTVTALVMAFWTVWPAMQRFRRAATGDFPADARGTDTRDAESCGAAEAGEKGRE